MRAAFVCAACVAGQLALAAPAEARWRSLSWNEVVPIVGGDWEVLSRPGSGPREYWCAAGDYARRILALAVTDRLYIVRAYDDSRAVPGYKSVTFGRKPPPEGAAPPSYSLSIRRLGDNMTVAAAWQYCAGLRRRF